MAITTTQELVASLAMSLPFPDGAATGDGERQHIAWQYAGILAGPLVPFAVVMLGMFDRLRDGNGLSGKVGSGRNLHGGLRGGAGARDRVR
jgi:hypothetical protein